MLTNASSKDVAGGSAVNNFSPQKEKKNPRRGQVQIKSTATTTIRTPANYRSSNNIEDYNPGLGWRRARFLFIDPAPVRGCGPPLNPRTICVGYHHPEACRGVEPIYGVSTICDKQPGSP
jgi:hypothetical protein